MNKLFKGMDLVQVKEYLFPGTPLYGGHCEPCQSGSQTSSWMDVQQLKASATFWDAVTCRAFSG